MGLGPVGPGAVQGGATGRARRRGGGFALSAGAGDSVAEGGAAEAGQASAAGPIGGLLALQESGAQAQPEGAEARARRRAGLALDELSGMQIDLLRGSGDPGRLERLAALAEEGGESLPPALAEMVAQVRLRARVELARRRRQG